MKKRKTILLSIGSEVFVCKCLISYDDLESIEDVTIKRIYTLKAAEEEGVDLTGISNDLVIEARIRQLVLSTLNDQ